MKSKWLLNSLCVVMLFIAGLVTWFRWQGPIVNTARDLHLISRGAEDHFATGQTVKIPGMNTGKKTLVLGVGTRCEICVADIPSFQKLAASKGIANGEIQVVGVFPEFYRGQDGNPVPRADLLIEANTFMKKSQLPGTFILQEGKYFFHATPNILLLDKDGKVLAWWKGDIKTRVDALIQKLDDGV